jgi:hypothetical protein
MNEIKVIHQHNINKLKHIYKNKNYKIQNVIGYCFICLDEINFNDKHYFCHDMLYSVCSSCHLKYLDQNKCLCESKFKNVDFINYCETSKIDINYVITQYFYLNLYIRKIYSNFYLKKNINIFKKVNLDNMLIVLKTDERYETCPRILQVGKIDKRFYIDKMKEGKQETIKYGEFDTLNSSSFNSFLENEKITCIDLVKKEDVVLSDYFVEFDL